MARQIRIRIWIRIRIRIKVIGWIRNRIQIRINLQNNKPKCLEYEQKDPHQCNNSNKNRIRIRFDVMRIHNTAYYETPPSLEQG